MNDSPERRRSAVKPSVLDDVASHYSWLLPVRPFRPRVETAVVPGLRLQVIF